MTIEQFQANKKLVKSAIDMFNGNATFQEIVKTVEESSPLRVPSMVGNSPSDHSHKLGFIEGYHHALQVLRATWTMPREPYKPIPERYEEPRE